MPLEIRELVIKTTVNRDRAPWQSEPSNSTSVPLQKADRAALVATCVEQVLAAIEAKSER
ncbi:MAG: DUF5908 family protein [Phormidesmis sp.]